MMLKQGSALGVLVCLVGLLGVTRVAEGAEVVLGWMNLDNCRTVEWTNDGPFGTPSPTYIESEQRVYVKFRYQNISSEGIAAEVKHCAERGVAAATVAGIVSNGQAAVATFYAVFAQCMGALYDRVTNLELYTETECAD